jgi:hypothetical protein
MAMRMRNMTPSSIGCSSCPTIRSFAADWWAFEFWRFVFVQQEVAKLGRSAIDFPPMQPSARLPLKR